MPEGVPLYTELTPREFVSYMADLKEVKSKEKKQMVDKVLEETGLESVQNKLIKNLSRGYKQRVSMAGALVGDPDVIILDEPTVGLDPKQITEIRNLIKELGKKHTVILSSHILSEVSQICERVIIINHGKIIAVDTPQNLEEKTKEKNTILVTVPIILVNSVNPIVTRVSLTYKALYPFFSNFFTTSSAFCSSLTNTVL